jgi:hypothetical protein
VKSGQSIKHNAPDYAGGDYNGIILAIGQDWVATQDAVLLLVYDKKAKKWKEEGGTTVALSTERPWYTAIKKNCPCFTVDFDSYIDNFTANGIVLTGSHTVTNIGTAGVQINVTNNTVEFTGTGTAYWIEIKDGDGITVCLFPLIENWRDIATGTFTELNGIWDVVTSGKFWLLEATGISTHDDSDYFYMHEIGMTIAEEGDYTYNVPYDLSSNPLI